MEVVSERPCKGHSASGDWPNIDTAGHLAIAGTLLIETDYALVHCHRKYLYIFKQCVINIQAMTIVER